MSKKKGITLIVVIMIMVIGSILALSLADTILNSLYLRRIRNIRQQALYAAQTGVLMAFEQIGSDHLHLKWSRKRDQKITDNIYYSVGKDANFFSEAFSHISCSGSYIEIRLIYCDGSGLPLNIVAMTLEWHDMPAGMVLRQVLFDNVQIFYGIYDSGMPPISPGFKLLDSHTPQEYKLKFIFNHLDYSVIDGQLMVTFFFADGSSRKVGIINKRRFLPAYIGAGEHASIISTGIVEDGNTRFKRTIEVTHTGSPGYKLTSCQEIREHI
ncbi:MAG: pilus assembly PilX N-terminal domain-containing protein [Candidatus Omnitrophica bacterium]|nr:pilus assembly PilX N-terminal domain-containing protein [Candidatus Omnitrophota bacterium]